MSDKLLFKKLEYIKTVCIGEELEKVKKKEKKDMTTEEIIKETIVEKIKETRSLLNKRNELVGVSDKAKVNHEIRKNIKDIKECIGDIEKIHNNKKRKSKTKSTNHDNCNNMDNNMDNNVNKEKEDDRIVQQLKNHLEILERKENPSKFMALNELDETNYSNSHSNSHSNNQNIVPTLQEIDDDDFIQLKKTDEELDKDLDDILNGVNILKNIANQTQSELENQELIMQDMENKTEIVSTKLKQSNVSLSKLLRKKSNKVCCSFVFIIIIIAIIFAIIFIVL